MAEASAKNIKALIAIISSGTLGSALVGLIIFGKAILGFQAITLQILIYGFLSSVILSLLILQRPKDAVYSSLLILAVDLMLFRGKFWLTHVLYFLAVWLSVFVFQHFFFRRMKRVIYLRPLLLGVLFMLFFLLDTLILSWIYSTSTGNAALFRNMPIGLLIGLGVGIGLEVALYFTGKNIN